MKRKLRPREVKEVAQGHTATVGFKPRSGCSIDCDTTDSCKEGADACHATTESGAELEVLQKLTSIPKNQNEVRTSRLRWTTLPSKGTGEQ